MTSKMKKLLALVMALCCLLLCACGPTETPPESTGGSGEQQPTGDNSGNTSSGIPDVDLGGFEFIMADWWSDPVPEEVEPDSAWDQMVQDYHKQLETDMNFDFKQIGLQNQGDFSQVLIDSLIQNKPLCSAFQMKLQDFTAMAAQGLLYDLGSLEIFDFENDPKWSQTIIDYFTIGGKIYAARPSEDQPRLGIYFNKRLFEEAGIDPEQPYDLQAAGQWDWEHFEELCQKLTRDTNADGVTDIYAFGGNDCEVMTVGIYGNGAMFVERDENGYFVDGTLNPAFEEGLNWAVSLVNKGYISKFGQGQAWDSAYTDFKNGKSAMLVCQPWVQESYLDGMADEIGYVMLPAGPKGHVCTNMSPTPICIPACIGQENAEKAAVIINTWYDTRKNIPGAAEMNITFRDDYYSNYADSRAVDETITSMITDAECQIYDSYPLIPGYEYYGYLVEVANQSATAAQKIEALRPVNQAAIDAANALFGKTAN